jgi:cysteine desulfurase
MQPYFSQQFYNPSATYLAGRGARQALDQARAEVAMNLGARPAEIIFTAGATEANNLAVQGVMRRFPKAEILTSTIEHESVLAPAGLFTHRQIPVNQQGIIDLEKLEKMISDKTVLVSVMLVNNELGTTQPLREIAKILNKLSILRRTHGDDLPLYLHADAAQAPLYLDLHVSRLGVDLLSVNGGKIYGPKQSGVLFIKAGVVLEPLILGGGQEFGLRSGTENPAAAVGIAKSLTLAQAARKKETERMEKLRLVFISELEAKIPSVIINGSPKQRTPHILSVTFPGKDNERLMIELDEAGIIAAVGSACSASKAEPSHVLSAIGLSDEQAHSTLRFSFGRGTTAAQLASALKIIQRFAAD